VSACLLFKTEKGIIMPSKKEQRAKNPPTTQVVALYTHGYCLCGNGSNMRKASSVG